MAYVTCIISSFDVNAILSRDLDCIIDGSFPLKTVPLCRRYRKQEESIHYKFWVDFYENGEGLLIDRSKTINRIKTSQENLKMVMWRDGKSIATLLTDNLSPKELIDYYGKELANLLLEKKFCIFQIPNGKRSLPTVPSIAIDILDVRHTEWDDLFYPNAFSLLP